MKVHLKVPATDRAACGKAISRYTRFTVNPSLPTCPACLVSQVRTHLLLLWMSK